MMMLKLLVVLIGKFNFQGKVVQMKFKVAHESTKICTSVLAMVSWNWRDLRVESPINA